MRPYAARGVSGGALGIRLEPVDALAARFTKAADSTPPDHGRR